MLDIVKLLKLHTFAVKKLIVMRYVKNHYDLTNKKSSRVPRGKLHDEIALALNQNTNNEIVNDIKYVVRKLGAKEVVVKGKRYYKYLQKKQL